MWLVGISTNFLRSSFKFLEFCFCSAFLVVIPTKALRQQAILTHPNRFGTYPNRSGMHSNAFGICPNRYGTYPNRFGTYPNRFGTYPNPSGTYANPYEICVVKLDVVVNLNVRCGEFKRPMPPGPFSLLWAPSKSLLEILHFFFVTFANSWAQGLPAHFPQSGATPNCCHQKCKMHNFFTNTQKSMPKHQFWKKSMSSAPSCALLVLQSFLGVAFREVCEG